MPADVTIRECPEAQRIARDLIVKHHAHLRDQTRVDLRFLTTTARRSVRGKEQPVQVRPANDLDRFLATMSDIGERKPDFFIVLSESAWSFFDPRERAACLDHALCHIVLREDKKGGHYTLVNPDVHEFADVVRRHGLWMPDLKLFARAMGRQAVMDLEGATEQEQAAHDGTESPFSPPEGHENGRGRRRTVNRPADADAPVESHPTASDAVSAFSVDEPETFPEDDDPDGDTIPETVMNARARLAGIATADHGSGD